MLAVPSGHLAVQLLWSRTEGLVLESLMTQALYSAEFSMATRWRLRPIGLRWGREAVCLAHCPEQRYWEASLQGLTSRL